MIIITYKDKIKKIILNDLDTIKIITNSTNDDFIKKLYLDMQKYLNSEKIEFNSYKLYIEKENTYTKIYKWIKNNVKWGKLITYKEVMEKLNLKNARIVGFALNKNPFPIIVPCHRVIKTNKSIGGFSEGKNLKIELLKLEGHKIKEFKIIY